MNACLLAFLTRSHGFPDTGANTRCPHQWLPFSRCYYPLLLIKQATQRYSNPHGALTCACLPSVPTATLAKYIYRSFSRHIRRWTVPSFGRHGLTTHLLSLCWGGVFGCHGRMCMISKSFHVLFTFLGPALAWQFGEMATLLCSRDPSWAALR
jgi:hypothetical protein